MSYQREFKKNLRVGLIGIGSHSYRNILPAFNYLPVTLEAVCNRNNQEMLDKTCAQYGCRGYQSTKEMYGKEHLDAVFICVSPQTHAALVEEALDAGLHVWVEKPPAMRAYEIKNLLDRCGDRVVVTGFKKVFMPATRKALEIMSSEKYGNTTGISAVYPMNLPMNGAEILEQKIFTNWLGNGCHPLSLLIAAGGRVKCVTTHTSKIGNGSVILEFEDGLIADLYLASGPFPLESYHFFGDYWHLKIENSTKVTLQRGIPFEYGVTTNFVPEGDESGAVVWEPQNSLATLENKALFVQGIYDEMKYFCDCIIESKRPEFGGLDFTCHVMQVYEAALMSQGEKVEIQ